VDHWYEPITTEGGIVSVDTETTGLNPRMGDRPFAFTFTDYEGDSAYLQGVVDPFTRKVSYSKDVLAELRRVMEDASITKVFHNAKFDIAMYESIGIKVRGKIWDTLIMAHIDDPASELGLKPLCKKKLDIDDDDQRDLKDAVRRARVKAKKDGWKLSEAVEADYWMAPMALVRRYALTDTERTMALYWGYEELMKSDEGYKNLVEMEHKVLWVTKRMEDRGIAMSRKTIDELFTYYSEIIETQDAIIKKLGYADLNTNSPKQMQKVFYDDLGMTHIYKVRKGKNGRTKTLTTDASALERWANEGNELAKAIITRGEAEHQIQAFIDTFRAEGMTETSLAGEDFILHPNYRTCGPITGRISCTKPNLMNISNTGTKKSDVQYRIREVFVPRKNRILYFADYSQVEVWLAMFLSQDPYGMEQLLKGEDMHGNMARKVWGNRYDFSNEAVFKKWRKRAKFILFGLIYGAGVPAIQAQAGCDEAEAMQIRDIFWKTFKGLYAFSNKLKVQAERLGYVENPFGRIYPVPGNESYKGLNYLVQGTAAEIMKRALINLDAVFQRRLSKFSPAKLLLTIHDEVAVEADERDTEVPGIILACMQDEFHKVLGMPHPFKAEVSIARVSWALKEEMDPQPLPADLSRWLPERRK